MAKFLLGNARHQLDDKGRMRIPAKFREVLGGQCCILPGRSGCLFIVPDDKLTETLDAVTEQNAFANTEKNDLATEIMSNAFYLEEDAQGRVKLPSPLAQLVGIRKDIVFVGKMTYLEVWPAEEWDARYDVLNPSNLARIVDKLKNLGV